MPSFVFSWVVFPILHTRVIGSKATFIDKWKTSLGVTSHQDGQVIEGRNVIRWFPRHNFGLTTFEPEKFDSRTRFFLPPYWIACINHTHVPATRVSCVRGFTFFSLHSNLWDRKEMSRRIVGSYCFKSRKCLTLSSVMLCELRENLPPRYRCYSCFIVATQSLASPLP